MPRSASVNPITHSWWAGTPLLRWLPSQTLQRQCSDAAFAPQTSSCWRHEVLKSVHRLRWSFFGRENFIMKSMIFRDVTTVLNERKHLNMSFTDSVSLILGRAECLGLTTLHCAIQFQLNGPRTHFKCWCCYTQISTLWPALLAIAATIPRLGTPAASLEASESEITI